MTGLFNEIPFFDIITR